MSKRFTNNFESGSITIKWKARSK